MNLRICFNFPFAHMLNINTLDYHLLHSVIQLNKQKLVNKELKQTFENNQVDDL